MVLYSSVISDGPIFMAATLHRISYSATGRLADNTHIIYERYSTQLFQPHYSHDDRCFLEFVARLGNVTNYWVWFWPSQMWMWLSWMFRIRLSSQIAAERAIRVVPGLRKEMHSCSIAFKQDSPTHFQIKSIMILNADHIWFILHILYAGIPPAVPGAPAPEVRFWNPQSEI